MARVLPFKALLHGPSRSVPGPWAHDLPLGESERRELLADPAHGLHLAEAFDARGALKRALAEGRLVQEATAGFPLLELASQQPGEAPTLYVFGMLPSQEGLPALEEGRAVLPAPWVLPTPVIAADDHRTLQALLIECAGDARVLREGTFGDARPFRLCVEERPGHLRRLQALLEEAPMRPLSPLGREQTHLCAILPLAPAGWRFQPFHRGIKGLSTFEPERFLHLVAEWARVLPLEARLDTHAGRMEARERLGTLSRGSHAVLVVLPGRRTVILRYRQGMEFPRLPAVPKSPTLRSLDLAMLNALILRTVLGIREPEQVGHPNVFPVLGIEALVRDVESGLFQVGFALNPPPAWEVRAVMEAGCSLPPRTLRLDPAPPAGLLYGAPD